MVAFSDLREQSLNGNPFTDTLVADYTFRRGYTVTYVLEGDGPNGGSIWANAGAADALHQAAAAWAAVADIQIIHRPEAFSGAGVGNGSPAYTWTERLLSTGEGLARHSLPGTNNMFGEFQTNHSQWSAEANRRGGLNFVTFLHEIGHGLGLNHPHADEIGERAFPGVTGQFSTGRFEFNSGLYTVMSYNDATPSIGDPPSQGYGWAATPMAFDIAAIQLIYGPNMQTGAGANTYTLPHVNGPGTFWQSIWDAGGIDTIVASPAALDSAVIDLRAATLRPEPGGGGQFSRVGNTYGGFTIANGVVIENATGGAGNDVLQGNAAANTLRGDFGSDRLIGGAGDDILIGGPQRDELFGGDGDDILRPGGVGELVDGGPGTDTLDFADSDEPVTVTLPNDTENLIGSAFADDLTGSIGANVIRGGGGDDTIRGGGRDTLMGEDGDDTIESTGIGATLDGGDGFDTLTFRGFDTGFVIDLTAGTATAQGTTFDRFTGFERVIGSPFDDVFLASGLRDDMVSAREGADRFELGGGFDTVSYAALDRAIIADLTAGLVWDGVALDRLIAVEMVVGTRFDDTMFGSETLADSFDGGDGADYFYGGGGFDTVTYAAFDRPIIADLTAGLAWDGVVLDRLVAIDEVVGTRFDDTMFGSETRDDTFDGGGGADYLYGGGGIDTVNFARSATGVAVDLDAGLTWDGVAHDRLNTIESAIGSRFDDVLFGSERFDDILDGGPGGADLLAGGGGSDTANYASSERGVIIDLIAGSTWDGVAQDRLTRVENAMGSRFADAIFGDNSPNILAGGGGADRLTGFGGGDRFVFELDDGAGAVIADFESGIDTIVLAGFGPGTTATRGSDGVTWTFADPAAGAITVAINTPFAPTDWIFG